MEEIFNDQNNRLYTQSSKMTANWYEGLNEDTILFWQGVSYDGVTSLHFCKKGDETAAGYYQRNILTNTVEPLNQ